MAIVFLLHSYSTSPGISKSCITWQSQICLKMDVFFLLNVWCHDQEAEWVTLRGMKDIEAMFQVMVKSISESLTVWGLGASPEITWFFLTFLSFHFCIFPLEAVHCIAFLLLPIPHTKSVWIQISLHTRTSSTVFHYGELILFSNEPPLFNFPLTSNVMLPLQRQKH